MCKRKTLTSGFLFIICSWNKIALKQSSRYDVTCKAEGKGKETMEVCCSAMQEASVLDRMIMYRVQAHSES
jgi:hypothetical protein